MKMSSKAIMNLGIAVAFLGMALTIVIMTTSLIMKSFGIIDLLPLGFGMAIIGLGTFFVAGLSWITEGKRA